MTAKLNDSLLAIVGASGAALVFALIFGEPLWKTVGGGLAFGALVAVITYASPSK